MVRFNLFNSSFFKKYLLPGFIFQSVIIAGGYGTGRELGEYFMQYGPLGGILGMFLVTMIIWGIMSTLPDGAQEIGMISRVLPI